MPEEVRGPRTEQELNRQLADTIGESVLQLLGGTGFVEANNILLPAAMQGRPDATAGGEEHPTPTAPVSGQPAITGSEGVQAKPTPTATPLPFDFEKFKDPTTGLYAGKYTSPEEYARGLGHAMNMTKSTLDENARLNQQLADYAKQLEELRQRPAIQPVAAPLDASADASTRGSDPMNPKLKEVLTSLEDNLNAENLGILISAISEQNMQTARQVVQKELEERDKTARANQNRWDKVDDYMSQKFPDSMKFTRELSLHRQSHPVIDQVVTALIEKNQHEAAMTYLWRDYATEVGLGVREAPAPFVPGAPTKENITKEIQGDAADQVRREAVEQARKDAGILSTTGTASGNRGVHETPQTEATTEQYAAAVAALNAGHGEAWRNIVFGRQLDHPIFNS